MIKSSYGSDIITKIDRITRAKDLPLHNNEKNEYIYCIGLIIGISRKYAPQIGYNKKPYQIFATDFSKPTYSMSESLFGGKDFNDERLNHKVYNFCMFPECFDRLADQLRDTIDLTKHVRRYDFFYGEMKYVTDEGVLVRPQHWVDKLDNHGIWCYFKLRTREYLGTTELQSCNFVSIIPLADLKSQLQKHNALDIWDAYYKGYEHTHIFDTIDLDGDITDDTDNNDEIESLQSTSQITTPPAYNEIQPLKRRRIDDLSPSTGSTLSILRYKHMKYSLIRDIKPFLYHTYLPQFLIVEKIVVINPKDSYVYVGDDKLLRTKQLKVELFDETGESLVVYIQGTDLCRFLGIDSKAYTFHDEVDAAIDDVIRRRYTDSSPHTNSYGILISQWEICDSVWQWKWEHTTGAIAKS